MSELENGVEQVGNDTPSEAGTVQAGTQTGEGGTGPVETGTSSADAVRAEEYRKLQGEYTRATQELSAYRKIGMSADEIRTAIDQQRAGQSAADVIRQYLESQSKPQDVNPFSEVFEEPFVPKVQQGVERVVEPRFQQLEQRINTVLSAMVENEVAKQSAAFLGSHPEYGLTTDQLKTAAMKLGPALGMRPDDPKLMAHAAVHALGGLDAIAEKAKASGVQAYIDQSKSTGRVGTTVQSGAPATKAEVPKNLKDPAFKRTVAAALEALDAAKK